MGRYEAPSFLVYVGITPWEWSYRHKKTKNMRRSLLFVIGAAMVLSSSTAFAQTDKMAMRNRSVVKAVSDAPITSIHNKKSGELKKVLKDKTLTHISITGSVDEKDVKYLAGFKNLVYLDLSRCYDSGLYSIPVFSSSLTTLLLPEGFIFKRKEDLKKMEKNINLTSFGCKVQPNFPNLPNLRKLYLLEYPDLSSFGKIGINANVDELVVGWEPQNIGLGFWGIKTKSLEYEGKKYPVDFIPDQTDFKGIEVLCNKPTGEHLSAEGVLEFPDLVEINGDYLSGCNAEKLVFSKLQKVSGKISGANLKEIVFEKGCNVSLGSHGMISGCPKLQRIVFNGDINAGQSFVYANLEELIVNGNSVFGEEVIRGNVKRIIFGKIPSSASPKMAMFKNQISYNTIRVPKGSIAQFKKMGFGSSVLFDADANLDLKITVKGGSILDQIPLDKINQIRSLTVTGILYESDLEIINNCKNLKKLDLGHAYTTLSSDVMARRRENAAFVKGLFGLMGEIADQKHENLEMTTTDYAQTKILTELVKSSSEVEAGDEGCIIPKGVINNLVNLETLILPYRLKYIESNNFNDCYSLSKVEWPNFIEEIESNCFNSCGIEEVIMPSSFRYMEEKCFHKCSSLRKMDFSKCVWKKKYWDYVIYDCAPKFEFRFPQGIQVVERQVYFPNKDEGQAFTCVFPPSVRSLQSCYHYSTLYFTSKEAPVAVAGDHINSPQNCKVYIPKGSMTSYYSAFKSDVDTLDFIEY